MLILSEERAVESESVRAAPADDEVDLERAWRLSARDLPVLGRSLAGISDMAYLRVLEMPSTASSSAASSTWATRELLLELLDMLTDARFVRRFVRGGGAD